MTDTLRDRIVRIQAEHIDRQLTNYDTGREECGCGHQGNATYREHLADAILAIPGIAVVELPDPSEFADMWLYGDVHVASPSTHPGTPVALEIDPGNPVCFSIEYARNLAAALLAAADFAERDQ